MNKALQLKEPVLVLQKKEVEQEIITGPHDPKMHTCAGNHAQRILAMRDVMEILGGKWKIQLIGLLLFRGKMRFTEILRSMDGIASKMLSKELHDLEANQLITRTVLQTKPVTVEYEATPYGKTLAPLVIEIVGWGMEHRKMIMKSDQSGIQGGKSAGGSRQYQK
jgi:DNA-binding HxlR family transcriptional regulator